MIIIDQHHRRKKHSLPGDFTNHLDSHFSLSSQTSECYSLDCLILFLLRQLVSLSCLDIFPCLTTLWCVFLRPSPRAVSLTICLFIYIFSHPVFLFLISFCPFFLLPQHLQLEDFNGHLIPNSLSCSSCNLDSWPHICFMLGFPSMLVEYTSEAPWSPVNPSHLIDPNLKRFPHAVSYPCGRALLLTSCCSISTSYVQATFPPPDIQAFFLLHSCSSITMCPSRGWAYLPLACLSSELGGFLPPSWLECQLMSQAQICAWDEPHHSLKLVYTEWEPNQEKKKTTS